MLSSIFFLTLGLIMVNQPTPLPNVPSPEVAGLIISEGGYLEDQTS